MGNPISAIVNKLSGIFNKSESNFKGSEEYWKQRYANNGNAGAGSYNKLAEFKAQVLNDFVVENNIKTVIEYGSGDGNQLKLCAYPKYVGFDVSPVAIEKCRAVFAGEKNKIFKLLDDFDNDDADLTLSLDVIYHLVENDVFYGYMKRLFLSSKKYVIIYASNTDKQRPGQSPHVLHRHFTKWIEANEPDWKLLRHIPNKYPYNGDDNAGSFADFYIFEKSIAMNV